LGGGELRGSFGAGEGGFAMVIGLDRRGVGPGLGVLEGMLMEKIETVDWDGWCRPSRLRSRSLLELIGAAWS
jgi:hypothetical protein